MDNCASPDHLTRLLELAKRERLGFIGQGVSGFKATARSGETLDATAEEGIVNGLEIALVFSVGNHRIHPADLPRISLRYDSPRRAWEMCALSRSGDFPADLIRLTKTLGLDRPTDRLTVDDECGWQLAQILMSYVAERQGARRV